MAEVLELKVKSNIKGTVKEVDNLTASLKDARAEASSLTADISFQNKILLDLEKTLINLQRLQAKRSPWENSLAGTATKIEDVTNEIKEQKHHLKLLKDQQRDNNAEIKNATTEQEALSDAKKKGTPISRAAATAVRGIGAAMKAMGIGLIISAFLLLKKALMSNETVMKGVQKITITLGNAIGDVVAVLVDTYKWITEASGRFDSLGKVIVGLINLAFTPFKLTLYSVMLTVQELILKFYEMKNAIPGKDETSKINELNASIGNTRKSLRSAASGAVASFKSVVTNAAGAMQEAGAIYTRVKEGISGIVLDTIERNTELVDSEGKTAKEIEEIGQKLMDFKQRLAEQQASAEKQTELEKVEAARQAHYAELKALEIDADEKARLKAELKEFYDNEATAIKKETTDREALELAELEEENFLLEIENLTERALARIEIEHQEAIAGVAEHENRLEMEEALNVKYGKAKKALDIAELKWDDMNGDEKLGIAMKVFGELSTILGEESAAGKAMAVGQATIATYLGATKAYTDMLGVGPAGPVLGAIAAAAVVASGLKNVQAILSTPTPGGGGGGGGGPQPDVPAATPAPEMMSGAFELGGGQEVEPARAYVVSDDITENQDGLALIRRRSTI